MFAKYTVLHCQCTTGPVVHANSRRKQSSHHTLKPFRKRERVRFKLVFRTYFGYILEMVYVDYLNEIDFVKQTSGLKILKI